MSGLPDLRGKVAVVTGGASGIGKGIATQFVAEGMRVIIADIEQDALDKTAAQIGAVGVPVDVSDLGSVQALARAAQELYGTVHVVCNNAGIGPMAAIKDLTMDDWHWMLGVNLYGVIHGVHTFLPVLRANPDGGHIVNTASMAGLSTAPFMSVYDVTKHGVVALSESMYKEFEATGTPIRVSVVCPGLINTSIMRSSRNRPPELADEGKAGPMAQAFGQNLADRLTRGYPPSEVADQVLRGIREKRFYIVPAQPEVREAATIRAKDIIELRNPTPRR